MMPIVIIAILAINFIIKMGQSKVEGITVGTPRPKLITVDGEVKSFLQYDNDNLFSMCQRMDINVNEYVILVNGIGNKTSSYIPCANDVIELKK